MFHVVRDVLRDTTTRLICGQASKGDAWGDLDLVTKKYADAEKDPDVLERLREINRQMRP